MSDEYDTEEIPAEQRAAVQNTHGCMKWDIKFMRHQKPNTRRKTKYRCKNVLKNAQQMTWRIYYTRMEEKIPLDGEEPHLAIKTTFR